jgi:phosphatidylinositol alpha 1,6-mannosyltransferase
VRIALVTESFLPRINGVTNSVIHASRNLASLGHEVTIVCADTYGSDQFEGIPVRTVPSVSVPGIHDIDVAVTSTWWLSRILADIAPDVVHVASPFVLGAVGVKAAKRLGLPVVAVFQTDIPGFARHYGLSGVAPLADAHVRRIHGEADLTLVPSSASHAYLQSLGVERLARWGRGVNTTIFTPTLRDENLRASWATDASAHVVVGYLGRLAPEKGVDRLADIQLLRDVQLVVIGDGPAFTDLQDALPKARFVGRRSGEDLGRYVASLDILVAPGENETFCQVIQEGMAAGVPVVAPAVGGPRDLINPGVDGFLYKPGDVSDMLEHVSLLVDDSRLRLRMGMNGFAKVASNTWAQVVSELVEHYESLAPAHVAA